MNESKFFEDPLVILAILLAGVFATVISTVPSSSRDVISAEGKVRYISIDGGFYGIITSDGKKYFPLNLPPAYKVDGLKVRFKAKPKNVATAYGWGKPIKILEIEVVP